MTSRPQWSQAACRHLAPDKVDELFFPHKQAPGRAALDRQAKRICEVCPIRVECLTFALQHEIAAGTWGGLTDTERKRARLVARRSA